MCSRRMFSTVRGMPLSARKSSRSTIDARYDLIVLGALRVARSDSSNPVAWRARSPAVDSATLVGADASGVAPDTVAQAPTSQIVQSSAVIERKSSARSSVD